MGFIIMKRKKQLRKQIASLKIQLAEFQEKAKSQSNSANKIQELLDIHFQLAHQGGLSCSIWLNCYLNDYLKKRNEFSSKAAKNTQRSKNVQSEIDILQKKLDSL